MRTLSLTLQILWVVVGIVCFVVLVSAAFAQVVLPDQVLTPGVIASVNQTEVCGKIGGVTYSQRHRRTTTAMKAEVRREYGMARCGEVDHRVELSLGGADVIGNLWCQPGPPVVWNFKLKDRLEALVWRKVCREHSMTLAQGQAVFLAPDWRLSYCRLIGGAPCPP